MIKYLFVFIFFIPSFLFCQVSGENNNYFEKDGRAESLETIVSTIDSMIYYAEYSKAIFLIDTAILLASNQNQLSIKGKVMLRLGIIYFEMGKYSKSSELFFKSSKLLYSDSRELGELYSYIGMIFLNKKDYAKALENFKKSLKFSGDSVNNLINLGTYYQAKNKLSKSLEFYEKAKDIFVKEKKSNGVGLSCLKIGYIYLLQKKYTDAEKSLTKADSIFHKENNVKNIANCDLYFAKLYYQMDKLGLSVKYAKKAYRFAENKGIMPMIYDGSQLLEKLFIKIGNQEKAYEYSFKKYEMKDSLDFEVDRFGLEVFKYNEEIEKKEHKIEIEHQLRYKLLLGGLIVLFLIIIVLSLITTIKFIRYRAENIQTLKMIRKFNDLKNIEDLLNENRIKKIELFSEAKEDISKLLGVDENTVISSHLKKLLRDIKLIDDGIAFYEFEVYYKNSTKDFRDNLLKRFPDLTANEQKLCVFIKLGMNTKDISKLTGQSTSSLEVARYRLRKKLGINNTKISLSEFISGISV